MAYSFDRVMGQLGKPQEKADIFGNQSGGSAQGGGGLGSGAEGDLGPSGGGDVANAKTNAATDPSDVSSSAAYRSNIGKTRGPDLGALRSGVDAKNSALDNEANAYLSNRASLNSDKLSDSDVDQLHGALDKGYTAKPTGEGPTPYDTGVQPKDSLGYWSQVANGQVEKVDPFKSTLNVTDPNVENLGTDAGVQSLLRKGNGPEYNIGDAAFDQALLGEDQGFQQGRQGLLESYKGLQDKQNAMGNDVTNKAQNASDSARSSYLADLKAKLGGFQNQFGADAVARERELEDAAAQREAELLGSSGGRLIKQQKAFIDDPANADLSPYATINGIDPTKFGKGTFDPNAYGYKDYLSDDDALKFNNIFSLLGSKDIYGKGSHAGGFKDDELASFDTNGMNQAILGNAQKGRAAAQPQEVDPEAAAQDKIPGRPAATPPVSPGKPQAPGPLDPGKSTRDPLERAGVPVGVAKTLAPDTLDPNSAPAPLQPGGILEDLNPANLRKRWGV